MPSHTSNGKGPSLTTILQLIYQSHVITANIDFFAKNNDFVNTDILNIYHFIAQAKKSNNDDKAQEKIFVTQAEKQFSLHEQEQLPNIAIYKAELDRLFMLKDTIVKQQTLLITYKRKLNDNEQASVKRAIRLNRLALIMLEQLMASLAHARFTLVLDNFGIFAAEQDDSQNDAFKMLLAFHYDLAVRYRNFRIPMSTALYSSAATILEQIQKAYTAWRLPAGEKSVQGWSAPIFICYEQLALLEKHYKKTVKSLSRSQSTRYKYSFSMMAFASLAFFSMLLVPLHPVVLLLSLIALIGVIVAHKCIVTTNKEIRVKNEEKSSNPLTYCNGRGASNKKAVPITDFFRKITAEIPSKEHIFYQSSIACKV